MRKAQGKMANTYGNMELGVLFVPAELGALLIPLLGALFVSTELGALFVSTELGALFVSAERCACVASARADRTLNLRSCPPSRLSLSFSVGIFPYSVISRAELCYLLPFLGHTGGGGKRPSRHCTLH